MKYGSKPTLEECLDSFISMFQQQSTFWKRPVERSDFKMAKKIVGQIFPAEQEERYVEKLKQLCKISGYSFSQEYRKRYPKKKQ